ncbi:hypothetical protein ACFX14_037754 [Malus domestica]
MSVVKESVIPVCNDIMAIPLFTFLNLTASQIILTRSSPFAFTHLFHIRYNSKDDLSAYTVHLWHMSMVKVLVLPVCDDIMVVNWVANDLQGPAISPPGSAIRLTFLKLKEVWGKSRNRG